MPDAYRATEGGPTRRIAAREAASLFCLYLAYVIGHFFFRLHIGFIVAVALAGSAYGAWRVKQGGRALVSFWGLRLDNLASSAAVVGPATALAAAAMVCRWWFGPVRPAMPGAFFALPLLYVPWAIVQQFLFQSLFLRDLQILTGRRWLPCLPTAVAFGLLHAISPTLAIVTFLAALFWSAAFVWRPNIIVLGISHGILGGMFFYLVAGEDVLRAVLGG